MQFIVTDAGAGTGLGHLRTSAALVALICSLAIAALAPCAASSALSRHANYWVSPKGNDRASGDRAHPLRTLARARDLTRSALAKNPNRDMRINLLGGTFRLANTLELNSRDSGRGSHTVTYSAAPGQRVTVSGAIKVSGWKLYDAAKNIYRARVGDPESVDARQLYVNGRRAIRARSTANPSGFYRTPYGYLTSDTSMASWGNPSDVELVTLAQWKMMRCPVASIEGQKIVMQDPCWTNANVFPPLWSFQLVSRIENAYELLDTPGEWYLDRKTGYLYYMPRLGEDLRTADVELPTLEALIDAKGSSSRPVENLRFEGITFAYGTWTAPSGSNGYAGDQSGWHVTGTGHKPNVIGHDPNDDRTPGNVRLKYARKIVFANNTFTHLGGVGLDFDLGSQHDTVIGNKFNDISSAAVQFSGVKAIYAHPSNSSQIVRENRITNNLITRVGREYEDAAGVMVGFATHTTIANNDISNVPWSGIAIGWGWGLYDPGSFLGVPGATPDMWGTYSAPTTSRGNRIIRNRISHFVGVLWDGGAIYTVGRQGASAEDGELIKGNVASGKRTAAGANTFYTDGGSRYVTLDSNVSFNDPVGITDFGPCGLPDSQLLCFVFLPYGSDSGGCRPYGDITYVNNYWEHPAHYFEICPYPPYPVNVVDDNNHLIAGSGSVSSHILNAAGRQGRYRRSVGAN